MSKPRYLWWSYVKGMIRTYPERKAVLESIKSGPAAVRYGSIHTSSELRQTETLALRELSQIEQREYEAVRDALIASDDITRKLIDLVYWQRKYTICGAAQRLFVSEKTAKRRHAKFIRCVATCYGLMQKSGNNS